MMYANMSKFNIQIFTPCVSVLVSHSPSEVVPHASENIGVESHLFSVVHWEGSRKPKFDSEGVDSNNP